MTTRLRTLLSAFLTATLTLRPMSAAAQCAMCGTAMQNGDDPLNRGLFWSVVFLISLPYTIVTGFILAIVWSYRRSKARGPHAGVRLVNPAGLHVVSTRKGD
jgi:heme/copper-type cytochrome/quinol oxidase subunit 2